MHPAHLRIALRDALLMAAADGHYDSREMDVVKQLAERAAFSPEDLEELYDWIDEGVELDEERSARPFFARGSPSLEYGLRGLILEHHSQFFY